MTTKKARHQPGKSSPSRLMARFLKFSVISIFAVFLQLRSREPSREVPPDPDRLLPRRPLGRRRAIVRAGSSGHTGFAGEEQPLQPQLGQHRASAHPP